MEPGPNREGNIDRSIYQVPVKTGEGPIRKNFDRTVINGVERERVSDIYDPPIEHDTLRIWGNQADEPAQVGDYLLFADRDGRHGGSYTILARVAHATVLDEDTAEAFTDNVGWGDVTDENFPHVMFLDPIYEAELDRASFWETLGFKGWPNDTFSGINFDRPESTFRKEYPSINDFLEEITGEQLYPEPSTRTYESLEEAVTDVADRLEKADRDLSWFTSRVGTAVIEDWSTALTGFKPSDEVTPETAAKLDQLRLVYESLETELSETAEKLDSGTLARFSRTQTLYLAIVRLAQEELAVPGGLLSQPRLNSVLRNTYSVTSEGGRDHQPADGHPVTDHIDQTEPAVYKFTAPPEYWYTALQHAAVSFEPEDRGRSEQVQQGDVAVLHARAEPSRDDLSNHRSGIIGVAVLGHSFEKDDPWWHDERTGEKTFDLVVSFDRLFLTGDVDTLDFTSKPDSKSAESLDEDLTALTANSLAIDDANEICANETGIEFPAQSMFGTFRTTSGEIDYDRPRALIEAVSQDLKEVSSVALTEQFTGTIPADVLDGLYFPDEMGDAILEQITTALRSGKHILLTGPPGTGKTEIAERVCRHLESSAPHLYSGSELTTATADWSTFDTVGGYMPSGSGADSADLTFTPGIVLNRLKDRSTGVQSNELIVIDELNRADIDKAFGQLFTLLSGQSVQLPYTVEGDEVELTTAGSAGMNPPPNQYVVPESWRIFATMNSYDKTSLYEMSYAFMRRFAFVRVPAPELPTGRTREEEEELERIVDSYARAWELSPTRPQKMAVGSVWRKTNQAVEGRAIGPAIIEDVLRYTSHHPEERLEDCLTQAVVSYILPQLEGVPRRKTIIKEIASVPEIDRSILEQAANEMLQVTLSDDA